MKKVALITGATRGIGAAIATEFARAGYDLSLTGRTDKDLLAVAETLKQFGAKPLLIAGDLGDLTFTQSLAEKTIAHFGRVDTLINNAAWREVLTMREISLESWEKTFRVCVTSPAFLSKWCASQMEKQGGGVIVNISSIMSEHCAGSAPAYVASKGAMDTLTFELAALYGPRNIRVVSLNPGAIDTDMGSEGYGDAEKKLRDYSEDMIPLKRWGTGEEIAKTVLFLASDAAGYITGTTIVADGGWSRQIHPMSIKNLMRPGQF